MKQLKKRSKGFSLIELIVSITIIGVISGLGMLMLSEGSSIFFSESSTKRVMDEGQLSIWKLMHEVRTVESLDNFATSNENRLYVASSSDGMAFEIDSDDNLIVNQGQVSSLLSDMINPLGDNAFIFKNSVGNIIETDSPSGLVDAENVSLVELNLHFIQNGEEMNISSHVSPRNSRYGRKLSFHE
jgi:prepilin-type N-terminal cleavage/methylation domain-containing protein